jgi:hypothetical protein
MKIKKILLLIIFILTMITFIYVSEKTDILFEYSKNCVTVNSEFEGKVKDFSNNRGTITINLYNNEIYTLYAEHNKSYKEPSFYFYLERGDSLNKKSGDSRIFLYRDEEVRSWELYDLVKRCE